MKTLPAILILLALSTPAFVVAQAPHASDTEALESHMRTVRKDIARKRESAFRSLLVMTEEQERAFWPLQKAYDKELGKLSRTQWRLIHEFGESFDELDADSAQRFAERFFALEREWNDLHQEYFGLMAEQVSPVIAVQFVQLERRFEAQALIERMKYTPLAE